MSLRPERYLPLRVNLPTDHPRLLDGLEHWLQLGLLTDAQVLELCQRYLISPLPVQNRLETETPLDSPVQLQSLESQQLAALQPAAFTTAVTTAALEQQPAQRMGWVSQFLQGLMNEISVIWLLCLGVFLVVVSSAVLAASQWQHVPPTGQYGILFGYTIAFAIASLWTGIQPQLQLTSWMLQITSLLIIPVNFWMMDGFHLLQTPFGMGIAAIAALSLSVITFKLLSKQRPSMALMANVVGLSWLHWGWGWSGLPLIATYVGCIGTSWVLFDQDRRSPDSPPVDGAEALLWWNRFKSTDIVLPLGVLLLLFRATVVAAVPVQQLGLALGICGWLLCWLARNNPAKQVWLWIGSALWGCGWVAGIGAEPPWQALLVSGLGLWLLGDRLVRLRQQPELVGLVGLGLFSVGLLVRIVPLNLRDTVIAVCSDGVGAQGMPDALWGVGMYPYLWGVLALVHRVRRWQLPSLIRTGYFLAGVIGLGLVGVSLANPMLPSLSLILALGTLIVTLRQHSVIRKVFVYVAQFLSLATACSILDTIAPSLEIHHWGVAALVGMGLEWTALLLWTEGRPLWRESTWFVGLGLAGLGYTLLFASLGSVATVWNIASLFIPIALTVLIFSRRFEWLDLAISLTIASTIAVQLLTFPATLPRLVGLALGMVLMALVTLRNPMVLSAALSVGFGLTLGYATAWEVLRPEDIAAWMLLPAVCAWILVGLRHGLSEDRWAICSPYRRALDGWTIFLTVGTNGFVAVLSVLALTLGGWLGPVQSFFYWYYPVSILLLLTALGYRYWQAPTQSWLVEIAETLEVFVMAGLVFGGQSLSVNAIATLALGITSVLVGEWKIRRTGQSYPWSWNLIPLGYAAWGLFLSILQWTATSGLYTIVFGLIAIAVGRRASRWRAATFVGLGALSFGSFELLLYPLLQAKGGQPGDGFVIFGAWALVWALAELPLERWGAGLTNLRPSTLKGFGQLHWGLGTVFLAIALSLPLSTTGEWIWGIEMLLLGGYALWQGRREFLWSYLGLIEGFAALGQMLYNVIPETVLLPWGAAIASLISLGLYSLPWERWGWLKLPFFQVLLVVPLVVAALTGSEINTSTLLLTAGFYGWMAFRSLETRLSYVGLVLANFAALRLLEELHFTSRVWGAGLVGLSLLFIAQVDPALRSSSQREVRHLLRCFAVGLMGVTALYESDPHFGAGLLAIAFSLGLVVLGLVLRVRAFLYVGTLTFIAKVLRIVWLFIADESLVLWGLGIALGLLLIWVAATFESRRSQMMALLQYWVSELERWQ